MRQSRKKWRQTESIQDRKGKGRCILIEDEACQVDLERGGGWEGTGEGGKRENNRRARHYHHILLEADWPLPAASEPISCALNSSV